MPRPKQYRYMSFKVFLCLAVAGFAVDCSDGSDSTPPSSTWIVTMGGEVFDEAFSIAESGDGGFLVAGRTESFGHCDMWFIKLGAGGAVQWQRTLGGEEMCDGANSIIRVREGGFLVAGYTYSFGAGEEDIWLVRLNDGGDVAWQKSIGFAGYDQATEVVETGDGGFVVAGSTMLPGRDDLDLWMIKLDASANVLWQKIMGGTGEDMPASVIETLDGDIVLAADTEPGSAMIMRLGSDGLVKWQKAFEGRASSILESLDGGIVLAGQTSSSGADRNALMMRMDAEGNILWQKAIGGLGIEVAVSVVQGAGGFIFAADKDMSGDFSELWLIKTDEEGNLLWQTSAGTGIGDWVFSAISCSDGGIAVAGESGSLFFGIYHDALIARLNDRGGISGTCDLFESVSYESRDSNVVLTDLELAPMDTSASLMDTDARLLDSNAEPHVYCPQ